MPNRLRALTLACVLIVAATGPALAGKAEEARALVAKAIAYYEEVGAETALATFNDKSGRFVRDAYYVFVAEADSGVFKAHPINSALLDNPKIWDLKDVNGRYIIRDMVKVGKESPEGGWTEYVWTHPVTSKLTPKRTWVRRHDGLLFMAGFYVEE